MNLLLFNIILDMSSAPVIATAHDSVYTFFNVIHPKMVNGSITKAEATAAYLLAVTCAEAYVDPIRRRTLADLHGTFMHYLN